MRKHKESGDYRENVKSLDNLRTVFRENEKRHFRFNPSWGVSACTVQMGL
jgi:hypothetical protein